MITCFTKEYFGFDCPGCGIQRSFICLVRGEWMDSLALYPALIPFMIFSMIGLLSLVRSTRIEAKWVVVLAIVTTVIMLAQFILKLLGLAPWYDHAAGCFH